MRKKKGFTYIEVMVAVAVFMVLAILVVRLNIAANRNMNLQADRQNMMMEAQKLLEKYKTTQINVGSNVSDFKQDGDYYVVVQGSLIDTQGGRLYEVTVKVRKNISNSNNEVVLKGHVLKN